MSDLTPQTAREYRSLAANFYSHIDDSVTPESMTARLSELSKKHGRNYWRRLRSAVAFDQAERGYSKPAKIIRAFQNPNVNTLPKQTRCRKISDADFVRVFEKSSDELKPLLMIAKITGARPSEYPKIIALGGDKFFIPSSKKRGDGDEKRGLDRVIKLSRLNAHRLNKSLASHAANQSKSTKKNMTDACRKELAKISRELWPRRKNMTWSTFRHQLGSNLKSSDLNEQDRAYILGHHATKSIESYGHKNNGTGAAGVDAGESSAAVRSNSTDFSAILDNAHHDRL